MPEVGNTILSTSPVVPIVDDEAVRLALSSLIRLMGTQVRVYESAAAFLDSGEATTAQAEGAGADEPAAH